LRCSNKKKEEEGEVKYFNRSAGKEKDKGEVEVKNEASVKASARTAINQESNSIEREKAKLHK
jgi:hypothetical protein